MEKLVDPHGGELKSCFVTEDRAVSLKKEARDLISWDLTPKQVCDIEFILNGAFSPLDGFMGLADYTSVLSDQRLESGAIWPMPIILDVTEEAAKGFEVGQRIALRHPEGMILAIMTVSDSWTPDFKAEAQAVFGTTNDEHPGVFQLFNHTHPVYVGGTLEGIEAPPHHTFNDLRHTPTELRTWFNENGWTRIVGFQTRNPLHQAHVALTRQAMERADAKLLIHPVVGRTKPGDIDYMSRVRCYKKVLNNYPDDNSIQLSLLPLAMRMGGPREALWHAIIRKNFGCSHFIVGRDHAGPRDKAGEPFYGPYDAQELVTEHSDELGIEMVTFEEVVYVKDTGAYMARSQVEEGMEILSLSGTEFRKRLREGSEIPAWFSYPEVVEELRCIFPPRTNQGVTVFFTGLSGAGKSTVAQVLVTKLTEMGSRPVTLLDGDIVRKNLSSELGFSKEHRDLNITRIGFVASEITKNHGFAICAPIAPYSATRRVVREMIEEYGGFVEVHISTPIDVCEKRDRKGLYAKARAGIIKEFTGISDPYEAPDNPEVNIDTTEMSAEAAAQKIIDYLDDQGYFG